MAEPKASRASARREPGAKSPLGAVAEPRTDSLSAEGLGGLQQGLGNLAFGLLLRGGGGVPSIQLKEEGAAETATPNLAPAETGLIVDDEASGAGPHQMKKSAFLAELRVAVCKTAEDALKGTIWSSMGCPWIDRWFGFYEKQEPAHIERSIRKYAGETARARTARDYIPIVCARVRRGVKEWSTTGEVSGLPPELRSGEMPGATLGGAIGALTSAIGGLRFKRRGGSAPSPRQTGQVRDRLGAGRSLDGGPRTRMESAFGVSFGRVRIHTDARAADLSEQMGARAFTVGEHVAFGPGEYQPGTPVGDALLAHELAHVVQQSVSSPEAESGGGAESSLEQDADTAAVGAVAALWTATEKRTAAVGRNALPSLKSGLRLQGCNDHSKKAEIEPTEEAMGEHAASCMLRANQGQTADSGIHYAENYKAKYPDRWKPEYENGLASPYYFDRVDNHYMDWRLKPGRSASEGIKAWLKGPTIAECLTTAIAAEIDTMRAALGDAKFDELYGSTKKEVPEERRLRIRTGRVGTPLEGGMTDIDIARRGGPGTIGHRPAKVGEWYYFTNHPKYLLKHPDGAWQGENAFYLGLNPDGNQLWSGLGATKTEEDLLKEMVEAYNGGRGEGDRLRLAAIKAANGGVLPPKYDPASGIFPDTITLEQLLNDPPYEIGGTTRKGGFDPTSGRALDPSKIKELKD